MSILLVEDVPGVRQLFARALTRAGYRVYEARNGLEAVELTHRLRPQMITMDIQMPNMDGLEATKRIMTEMPTPVVVVSTGQVS